MAFFTKKNAPLPITIKDNTLITLWILFKVYNLLEVNIFLHTLPIFILKGQLILKQSHMDKSSLLKGHF